MEFRPLERVPIMTTLMMNGEDLYRMTMDIMRYICADINNADVKQVIWLGAEEEDYTLVIMISFDDINKRDAVLNAAAAKRPLYTDDIPAIKRKMENQHLSLHKKLPKYLPRRLYDHAKRATDQVRARATQTHRE